MSFIVFFLFGLRILEKPHSIFLRNESKCRENLPVPPYTLQCNTIHTTYHKNKRNYDPFSTLPHAATRQHMPLPVNIYPHPRFTLCENALHAQNGLHVLPTFPHP